MTLPDNPIPPNNLESYSQSWPDKKTFAGMELDGFGGDLGHDTSYETESRIGEKRIIVRLDFNTNLSRQDDGTDVLNTPSGFALDIKAGEGGDRINPSMIAFRATDLGKKSLEIYVQNIPLDGKTGLTYSLQSTGGVLDHITLDEADRTPPRNTDITINRTPTLFTETPIHDDNDTFLYNEVTITDASMINLLEKLGLPTTWRNMQKPGNNNLNQPTIASFPELLKKFEDLVLKLQSRKSNVLLQLMD